MTTLRFSTTHLKWIFDHLFLNLFVVRSSTWYTTFPIQMLDLPVSSSVSVSCATISIVMFDGGLEIVMLARNQRSIVILQRHSRSSIFQTLASMRFMSTSLVHCLSLKGSAAISSRALIVTPDGLMLLKWSTWLRKAVHVPCYMVGYHGSACLRALCRIVDGSLNQTCGHLLCSFLGSSATALLPNTHSLMVYVERFHRQLKTSLKARLMSPN